MTASNEAPGELDLVRQFVNTRDFDDGDERLGTPGQLRAWLVERGLLAEDAPVAEADVHRALEVREALRSLCLANNGEPLERGALEVLNSAAGVGPVRVAFEPDGGGRLVPAAPGVSGAIAALLATVFRSMVDGTWQRLKTCPAHDCLWAFYDHSRNRSGHWCTMAGCGNREKARAYRRRRQAASA